MGLISGILEDIKSIKEQLSESRDCFDVHVRDNVHVHDNDRVKAISAFRVELEQAKKLADDILDATTMGIDGLDERYTELRDNQTRLEDEHQRHRTKVHEDLNNTIAELTNRVSDIDIRLREEECGNMKLSQEVRNTVSSLDSVVTQLRLSTDIQSMMEPRQLTIEHSHLLRARARRMLIDIFHELDIKELNEIFAKPDDKADTIIRLIDIVLKYWSKTKEE